MKFRWLAEMSASGINLLAFNHRNENFEAVLNPYDPAPAATARSERVLQNSFIQEDHVFMPSIDLCF